MKLGRFLLVAWLLVLASFIAMCFAAWCMYSLPVSKEAARSVLPGMQMDEVKHVLGTPSEAYKASDTGNDVWVYGHSLQWNFFSVYFTGEGKVEYAEYGD